MDLFDTTDYIKLETVDFIIDNIRKLYSNDSVIRAAFVAQTGIDHMSGGISREKRSVDYSQLKID